MLQCRVVVGNRSSDNHGDVLKRLHGFDAAQMDFQLEHLEMEFTAETWWLCSPHEYYKTTKFQLQAPSLSGSIFIFLGYFFEKIKKQNFENF